MSYLNAIGKTFFYRAHEVVIRDCFVDKPGILTVVTNKSRVTIPENDFKKEFLPVETSEDRENAIISYHGIDKDALAMRRLSDTLMTNIEAVKTDAKFIDQAKTINESAKVMIELQKTKIDMIRVMNEIAGGSK